jgi:hypothetical protein
MALICEECGKIYHIDKTRRENFVPQIEVENNADYLVKAKNIINSANSKK